MNIHDKKKLEEKRYKHLKKLFLDKRYNELLKASNIFTKQYPLSPGGFNLLGLALFNLEKYTEATELYEGLLNNNPNILSFLNNLGDIYRSQGSIKKALEMYKRAVDINPDSFKANFGLGRVYFDDDKMSDALLFLEKAFKLKINDSSTCYYLGEINKSILQYDKAISYYKLSGGPLSNAHILECIYLSKDRSTFYEEQERLNNKGELNPHLASIQTHASIRYDIPDGNHFCQSPFDFINHSKLTVEEGFDNNLIDKLNIYKEKLDYMSQELIKNGNQTSGNIFASNEPYIKKIKDIIMSRINKYREFYKDSDSGFIKKWPSDFNIQGWIIDIKKGGNLKSHMHKSGWLSGSLYLNVPKEKNSSEGNLVFSLDGENLPSDGKIFPSKEININTGDIILFPSSIFHHTLPFDSEENRITFAFDVYPN